MSKQQVIIVGAGPAGVRCAQTLAAAGLRPLVVDEGRRDGGQIYRRQPDMFRRPYEKLYGTEAARAKDLHESFDRLRERIDYHPDTLAWNLSRQQLYTAHAGISTTRPYDALVLCPGATDRLMPIKGWQYAGCYSLGASQIALKSQAVSIGRQVVFVGSGPLLYLVASQYVQAGAKVGAVLDTSRAVNRLKALPKLLSRPDVLRKGAALVSTLKHAGVQVINGIEPLEVLGNDADGVNAIRYRDAKGAEHALPCDAIAMGYHLRSETQLADLAGCRFSFHDSARQWFCDVDDMGRSTVPGVYLAGDGVRVLGADGAEAAGRLAAYAVLKDFGMAVPAAEIAQLQREREKMKTFAAGLAAAFPWPAQQAARLSDDTVVCRCEGITAGELRRVIREEGAREANRAKAFSRVGMGRCQGRYCGLAGAEIIAAEVGIPLEKVGRLRTQGPVKPFSIGTSAAALSEATSNAASIAKTSEAKS